MTEQQLRAALEPLNYWLPPASQRISGDIAIAAPYRQADIVREALVANGGVILAERTDPDPLDDLDDDGIVYEIGVGAIMILTYMTVHVEGGD